MKNLLLLLSLTSFTQKILAQHLDSQGQRLFEGDNVMLKIDSSIYEKATISDLGTSERRSENPKRKVTYSYLGGLLATQRVTYKIDSRYSVTAHYGWFPLFWQEVSIEQKDSKFPDVHRAVESYDEHRLGETVSWLDNGKRQSGDLSEIFSNGIPEVKTGYFSSRTVNLQDGDIINPAANRRKYFQEEENWCRDSASHEQCETPTCKAPEFGESDDLNTATKKI